MSKERLSEPIFSERKLINDRRKTIYKLFLRELIKTKYNQANDIKSYRQIAEHLGYPESIVEEDLKKIDRYLYQNADENYYKKYKDLKNKRRSQLCSLAGKIGAPIRNRIYGTYNLIGNLDPNASLTSEQRSNAAKKAYQTKISQGQVPVITTFSKEDLKKFGRQGYQKTLANLTPDQRQQIGREARLKTAFEPTKGEQDIIDLLTQLGRYTTDIDQATNRIFTHYESFVYPTKQYVVLLDNSYVIPDFVSWEYLGEERIITKVIEVYGKDHDPRLLKSRGRTAFSHYTDPIEKEAVYAQIGINAFVITTREISEPNWPSDSFMNWLNQE